MVVPKNNYFKGILLSTVVVFIFLSIGAEFFHDHDDTEFHNDCHVCIWIISLVFILSVFLLLPIALQHVECISVDGIQIFFAKSYRTFRCLRSPPSLA